MGTPATSDPTREMLLEFLYLAPVGILKFRPNGAIEMINPTAAQLLMPLSSGADLSDLYDLLTGSVPDLPARIACFPAASGAICDQIHVLVPATRSVLAVSITKIDPDTLMAAIQDVTRAVAHERRIRDDQARFRAIFDHVRDYAIYTVDLEGRIDAWNRSLSRTGGWEAPDVAGISIDRFFVPELDGVSPGLALLDRARQRGSAEFEGWSLRKDGVRFWGNTVATALPDDDGRPVGYVLVTRDLTERKQIEDRLHAEATTDPLTGAANRRAGEARLAEAFRGWQRLGRGYSVLMIDCDHFKAINDRWGHETGDKVLVALVRTCQDNLRSGDVIFRWGGEEFLVLLPDANLSVAMVVAEHLRLAIGAVKITSGVQAILVTVSIGVAVCAAADLISEEVVRRVDQALYRAKRGGRNQVASDENV